MDPYVKCPIIKNENFLLRFIERSDAPDLLLVYSDEKVWPIFNSDNCVDDFRYTSIEQMRKTIEFWLDEYKKKYYVRWAIVDRKSGNAIGTIELFNRKSDDYFNNCGILRLDLRSDYEHSHIICEILSLITETAFDLFGCSMIATKVPSPAAERRIAATKSGFVLSHEKLINRQNGSAYADYYVLHR